MFEVVIEEVKDLLETAVTIKHWKNIVYKNNGKSH